MARRFPFLLVEDRNGTPVPKFLDAFETVRMDTGSDPMYYGDMHPDRHFVIRRHAGVGTPDEHITFYFGTGTETLTDAWPNRATLEYAEYSEVF